MSCLIARSYYNDEVGTTLPFHWRSATTDLPLNLVGHTFRLKLMRPLGTVVKTKLVGIVGGDGGVDGDQPNVTVTWASNDLAGLDGIYWVMLEDLTTGYSFQPGQYPRISISPRPT